MAEQDKEIGAITGDELLSSRTRFPPLAELFNHDYVAACHFMLDESMGPAELVLMVGGRGYPVMTLAIPPGSSQRYVLIDKIHVHAWWKRKAE
jgi:hypothetical protein